MHRFHTWPVITVENFGKQAAGTLQHRLRRYGRTHTRQIIAQFFGGHDSPCGQPSRNPVTHFGGSRARIGDAQDAFGWRAIQHQAQYAIGKQLGLAGARIRRNKNRHARIGCPFLLA